MSESVQLAIVSAISIAFGVFVTKGIDAVIRWRKAEGQMNRDAESHLSARIVHLESEVARLQSEVADLQYRLGKSDAIVELLQGRIDKADLPQMKSGE